MEAVAFMKKPWALLLVVAMLFSLSGCFTDDFVQEREVVSYVQKNQGLLAALLRLPQSTLAQSGRDSAFLREALGRKTIVKRISLQDDGVIEFYCGGKGFGGNSTYVGFYYSAGNVLYDLYGNAPVTETAPGEYRWQNDDCDTYYTFRILPGWFYYMTEIY